MSSESPLSYRADIDGLRAVAVLSVVAFHAVPRLVPGGFIGVDIFFVISGYLISGIILKGLDQRTFSFAEFYTRRIKRIFPALVVVLAAVWTLGWWLLWTTDYAQLGKDMAGGAGFIANFMQWQEAGYFDAAAAQKPLLHLWSLGIEEQFYLIWPLVLSVAWKQKWSPLIVTLAIAAGSFAANLGTVHAHKVVAFYFPITRFWELLLGAVLAYALLFHAPNRRAPERPGLRNAAAAAGLLLIVVAIAACNRDSVFPGWLALLPTVGACLLIAAGPDAWINHHILARPALVFVGLISYPLYLWHWPLLSIGRTVDLGIAPRLVTIGAVTLAFALAWCTYRWLEHPIRSHRGVPFDCRAVTALLGALLVVAVTGGVTAARNGFPSRFPPEIQRIADFKYSYAEAFREGTCFLRPEQRAGEFADECLDRPGSPPGPLLYLWGDSHAAHLYPGLRDLQQQLDFRIGQFTASACAPLVDAEMEIRPNCRAINQSNLDRIAREKPETVLLAAFWPFTLYELGYLDRTVAALKQLHVDRIILVGPVPIWTGSLPKSLFAFSKRDALHRTPARMQFGLVETAFAAERDMRARAARLGIVYISAIDELCNEEGCLTRGGEAPDDLIAYDNHHLTGSGSRWFAGRIAARLFTVPPQAAHAMTGSR